MPAPCRRFGLPWFDELAMGWVRGEFRSKALGVVALLMLALTGCVVASGASVQQLRVRATFDLQCPVSATELVDIDERTKGVRGCGKQLTYVEVCDSRPDGWHCTWVLNAPAWYVAPSRVPPRPAGTWWWTQPQGVPVTPQPAVSAEVQAPVVQPELTDRKEPIVAPPVLPPVFAPPAAVSSRPLGPVPSPSKESAPKPSRATTKPPDNLGF